MAIEQINFGADLTSIGLHTQSEALFAQPVDDMGRPIGKSFALGFADTVDVTFEATKIDLFADISGTRAKVHTVTTEKNGSLSISFRNFNAKNMSLFAYGDLNKVTANPTKTETIDIYADDFVMTGDVAESVTSITMGSDVLEEGKNYEISKGGLITIYSVEEQTAKGAAEVVPDTKTSVVVVYASKASDRIEAFNKSANRLRIFYNGINDANGDLNERRFVIYYVELDPGTIPFSSQEDFGEITLTGTILAARSIAGAGLSKFMKIDVVK